MSVFTFRTITAVSTGLYKDRGSRFLSFACPVDNVDQIREHLTALKKEYYDARHHCFAWMLGPERTEFRAFDDGEPNHSAGDPILGQIRSAGLTNILIVVVRYFGGTKLGVGGLIKAYKSAAADALAHAPVAEIEVVVPLLVRFQYSALPEVMRLVHDFNMKVAEQDFTEACVMNLTVELRRKENVLEKLNLLNATGTPVAFSF
jgi:uncharacterized YigZ family protein